MKSKTYDLLYTRHNVFVTQSARTTTVIDSVKQSNEWAEVLPSCYKAVLQHATQD